MSITYKTLFSVIASLITSNVLAQQYSSQLSVNHSEIHPSDNKDLTLAGQYYFSPVATDTGPLQQAAFIQRSSSVGLAYSDTDFNPAGNTDSYSLFGKHILKNSGWFVAAQYLDLSGSTKTRFATFTGRSDADGKEYSLTIGKYLLENTTLELSYQRMDIDESIFSINTNSLPCNPLLSQCPIIITTTTTAFAESKNSSYAISLKHLGLIHDIYYQLNADYADIENKARFGIVSSVLSPPPSFTINNPPTFGAGIDGGVTFIDPNVVVRSALPPPTISFKENFSSYNIGLTLYPTRLFSVGIDYFYLDNNATKPETYTLNIEWFVLPSLSVNFSYGETNYENQTYLIPGAGQQAPIVFKTSATENYSLGFLARF